MTNEIIDHHENDGRSCRGVGRTAVEWRPLREDAPRTAGGSGGRSTAGEAAPHSSKDARTKAVTVLSAVLTPIGLLALLLGVVLDSPPLLVGGVVLLGAAGIGVLVRRRASADRPDAAHGRGDGRKEADAEPSDAARAEQERRTEPRKEEAATEQHEGEAADDTPLSAPVEEPIRERPSVSGLFVPSPSTPVSETVRTDREETDDETLRTPDPAPTTTDGGSSVEEVDVLAEQPAPAVEKTDEAPGTEPDTEPEAVAEEPTPTTEAPTTDTTTPEPETKTPTEEPEPTTEDPTPTTEASTTDTTTPETKTPTEEPEPTTEDPTPTTEASTTDTTTPEPETPTEEPEPTTEAPAAPLAATVSAAPTDDPFARQAEAAGMGVGALREIARAVIADQNASIVYVQQHFSLSRPAARRALDALEQLGLVSAPAKNGRRKALVTSLDHLAPSDGR
ncbi:DNA translocase FtsK [Streptomyces taklimakanensis]|uniref:DNA translocase FtsK n=1 Tax=Streptomyces taklimakanensis TaxID=2569853 RepID=UPI0013920781